MRMAVVSRLCTPEQPKDKRKQGLARRGKGGESSHGCTQGECCASKSTPKKRTKRGVNKKANGTIKYKQCDSKEFVNCILESKKISVNKSERKKFLKKYKSEDIYSKYANYIINS